MAFDKQSLRKVFVASRARLLPQRAQALSQQIAQRVVALPGFSSSERLVLYASVRNEVSTEAIFAAARAQGKRVYFPKVNQQEKKLIFAEVKDLGELLPGAFGIPEPDARTGYIGASELSNALICVPGLAFTKDGLRLGYGHGYYDRLMAELKPGNICVGLAYAFQVVEKLPSDRNDRRVDFVVTEYSVHSG